MVLEQTQDPSLEGVIYDASVNKQKFAEKPTAVLEKGSGIGVRSSNHCPRSSTLSGEPGMLRLPMLPVAQEGLQRTRDQ